jgi:hypothetical protein
MDGDVLVFAQVMTVIIASTGALLAIGLGAWHVNARLRRPRAAAPVDNARLERLEAAVDAIAVEVERISESQRYTVNLLSDRLPPRPVDRLAELPSSTKRANTPH